MSIEIPNHPPQLVARRQHGVQRHAPMVFRTPNGEYLRLASTFDEHYQSNLPALLQNHNMPVLERTGTKYTIVIHIKDQTIFKRQKYSALRSSPRTLGSVAKQVAEVVSEYIYETKDNLPSDQKDTWRLGPGHIKFEDLYLVELRQISRASFQVSLACKSRIHRPAPVNTKLGNDAQFGLVA